MEIKNAIISSTTLGREDHGVWSCMVMLDYGNSGQGFGGYCLDDAMRDSKDKFIKRIGTAVGMQFLIELCEAVGAMTYEGLVGLHVRVEASHDKVHRIGHILKDTWFDPKELFSRESL